MFVSSLQGRALYGEWGIQGSSSHYRSGGEPLPPSKRRQAWHIFTGAKGVVHNPSQRKRLWLCQPALVPSSLRRLLKVAYVFGSPSSSA